MTKTTYALDVSRDGRWWSIYAPAIDLHTQALKLNEVEEMGRDLIAGMLDVAPDSFEVDIRVSAPADVAAMLDEAVREEAAAREATRKAARDRRAAVSLLHRTYGVSASDTARMLGVTRGRVYHLLDEAAVPDDAETLASAQ
jgi:DNA invertase Pin-like site-specific DNA recombinase